MEKAITQEQIKTINRMTEIVEEMEILTKDQGKLQAIINGKKRAMELAREDYLKSLEYNDEDINSYLTKYQILSNEFNKLKIKIKEIQE